MIQMIRERECRGKYYTQEVDGKKGYFQEFEKGTFLCFGIDYEEFESGPAQYTTAIIELKDGRVITTSPEFIQFSGSVPVEEKSDGPLTASMGAVMPLDDETPYGGEKKPQRKKEREKSGTKKESERKRIGHRKIRALKNAGWSNQEIAEEMHMTPNGVANSLSTHKELIEELKKI